MTQTQTQRDVPRTDVQDSNPNGNNPDGLTGDLGISSERTGPAGDLGAGPEARADMGPGAGIDGASVEGTGSHGSAASGTDGLMDSTPGDVPRQHPDEPAEGGDPDVEPDAPGTERTTTEEPAEGPDDPEHTSADGRSGHHLNGDNTSALSGVDRTVGEVMPDPVADKHQFDPSRNPGH